MATLRLPDLGPIVGHTTIDETWVPAYLDSFVEGGGLRETALLARIDDAFTRTINANANVTAYLKSLLKEEEMQDRVLQATGLKELRDEIAEGLAEASRFAAEATKTKADPLERED